MRLKFPDSIDTRPAPNPDDRCKSANTSQSAVPRSRSAGVLSHLERIARTLIRVGQKLDFEMHATILKHVTALRPAGASPPSSPQDVARPAPRGGPSRFALNRRWRRRRAPHRRISPGCNARWRHGRSRGRCRTSCSRRRAWRSASGCRC